jgi:hypothetical protein
MNGTEGILLDTGTFYTSRAFDFAVGSVLLICLIVLFGLSFYLRKTAGPGWLNELGSWIT